MVFFSGEDNGKDWCKTREAKAVELEGKLSSLSRNDNFYLVREGDHILLFTGAQCAGIYACISQVKGKAATDSMELGELGLKQNFKLMMMGR